MYSCEAEPTIASTSEGVQLYINTESEEAWILVQPEFGREALRQASRDMRNHGYEAMPDWECPPEQYAGGATRYWLAEIEKEDDDSTYQAVERDPRAEAGFGRRQPSPP